MNTNINLTDVDARISSWKKHFEGTALTADDVEELAVQLKDTYLELLAANLSADEAWLIATHRMGMPVKPEVTEAKAPTSPSTTNRNWMMLVWGAVAMLILQAVFIVMPLLFDHALVDLIKPADSSMFLQGQYYTIAVVVIVLFIFLFFRSGSVVNRFSNSLTRHASLYAIVAIVAGLWAAFCSYVIFVKYPSATAINDHSNETHTALSIMMFGFYFPLIAVAAFSTIRYYSGGKSSFTAFNRNINWKHAFIFGLLAQTPVQFSHVFGGSDAVRYGIIIGLSVILFAIIGWMLSYAQNGPANLAAAQAAPLGILVLGLVINPGAAMAFTIFYLVKVVALVIAWYAGQARHREAPAI